ncbi:MAG TPA: hypothetical protein VFY29_20645 [Terriglobia bacterium]|nr:hypothetical protein [Terriglobia bacterium]
MSGLSYPAARKLAERLDARWTGPPDARQIEEIVSAAFWASLRSEEGLSPKISLCFLKPKDTPRPLLFDPRLRLEPNVLARLAPAVQRPGIHIGIADYEGQLDVWGITRTVPPDCFVVEVASPGLLVVKTPQADSSTKFANVAVLEGADVKFLERCEFDWEAPPSLRSLIDFYSSAGRNGSGEILIRAAIAMRSHGHGGSLLIVPKNSRDWVHSILHPAGYSVIPPTPDFHTFLQIGQPGMDLSPHAIQSAVDALAGLTAVDGAAIMSDHFEALAFGAKIRARSESNHVEQILLTEPIEGAEDRRMDASQLGGTRHLSAAQFVHDQRNALALVASQDGQFTAFVWSKRREMVHAHRLEALLI